MQVRELMSQDVLTCQSDSTLAEAAMAMWKGDCGFIPVLDDGEVRGVITDRDICFGVMTRGLSADQVFVGQVMTGEHYSCLPEDRIQDALHVMRIHQVRRLPVVDEDGVLVGVLSINDVVLEASADPVPSGKPDLASVLEALQEICSHRNLPVAV